MTLTEIRSLPIVELESMLRILRKARADAPGQPASAGPVKKISKRFLARQAAAQANRG